MMMTIIIQNFDKCMEMLLVHEGGFVNHPSDPGGMTNLGVTKSTWDHFYGDDIDEERMRNITVDDIKPIYRTNYWDRCRCGDLPSRIDWAGNKIGNKKSVPDAWVTKG